MNAQEILYQQMVEQFDNAGVIVSPAELHGHLCGRHVVGHHVEGSFGLRMVSDYVDLTTGELEAISDGLGTLINQWVLVMDKELFDFRLFLPEDSVALSDRLEELAAWCEGFLNGLATTAGDDEAKLMQAEEETLADLVEISRLETVVEDTDENEALYAEVSEFVRLAAFNLFDQFRALAEQQNQNPGVIH
ncbi:MAG: UPF0149 family protein [Gammaproteobacteria bacterium]